MFVAFWSLGRLGSVLERFRSVLKRPGAVLEPWPLLEASGKRLGSILEHLGGILERLGGVLERLGALLNAIWPDGKNVEKPFVFLLMWETWPLVGASWACLGSILEHIRASWSRRGGVLECLGSVFKRIEAA